MKKLLFALILLCPLSAQADTIVDKLVWEASPRQETMIEHLKSKMGGRYRPYWYTYDWRTKLCFAKEGHGMTVVPCTDKVMDQIIRDYSK